jgi:spore coat protein A, manganese oxidase
LELTRRDLMKAGLFGSAALMLPIERVARTKLAVANRIPQSQLPAPFTIDLPMPRVITAQAGQTIDLTQRQVDAEILPGLQTVVWGYAGEVPGPTIEVFPDPLTGVRPATTVRQRNHLPDLHPTLRYTPWTSTHLHGSPSLPQYDGYASDITNPGERKDYHYPNVQPARTLWYHDHGVHITASNAYMGLAALYILHDAEELGLTIPHGAYDVPLILKDALFEKSGALIFDDQGGSGLFGDVILVNGKPWPRMEVEPRKYRFRLLNASISRSYDLALSTGDPFTVIGTDGGLMPERRVVESFRHGMAERYEVVIDFANLKGKRVVLENRSLPNNVDFETTGVVMAFDVLQDVTSSANNEVPAKLNPGNETMLLEESQARTTRLMDFKRQGGEWTVNGLTWEDVINSGFNDVVANPGLDDVEIWELRNKSGGWFHPVHIHLIDFQVLDRNGQPPHPYERGPKDTVYVGEGEAVRVLAKFGPNKGRYMMHCHNLVHEDHDMMVQYEVGNDGDDPITADPAVPDV